MTTSMSAILVDLGSIVDTTIGFVGQTVTTITSNKLLLLAFLIPLCGIGVGIVKRLLTARA
jgi:hypothetical protein